MAGQYWLVMISLPVFILLALDCLLFLVTVFVSDKSLWRGDTMLLSLLFFCSGMPALVYQIVWERILFAIYGVNAQSVAVIVSAFMLGLGLGALMGGKLSVYSPPQAILFFSLAEFGTAMFGLASLRVFHWAARFTAGVSLPYTVLFTFVLLVIPTALMGATLPLLAGHWIRVSGRVGFSVATLYFVNTLGSGVACALCASFLLRDLGQRGSISIAAIINMLVGAAAFFYGRNRQIKPFSILPASTVTPHSARIFPSLQFGLGMLIAGVSGFIALGFEIVWFRVFSLAASDRAPAFALLLSTYLAGIALGSFVVERFTDGKPPRTILQTIAILMVSAGATSVYLPPFVAAIMSRRIAFLMSAPAFFLVAALIGSILPLACQLAVSPDNRGGRGVGFVYVSNIIGSTSGSLGVGFLLMNYFGLRAVSLQLGLAAVLVGGFLLLFARMIVEEKPSHPPIWAIGAVLCGLIITISGSQFYSFLFERLIFAARPEASQPFAQVVENRNGIIAVTTDSAVFGGGVYDGVFNVDPLRDSNYILRAYALSAFAPTPKKIFVLGMASGSWAQILANNPQVESVDVVEINPGYLRLIPKYPEVRSLQQNPHVKIYIDDARRWLVAHPEARYDAIIANQSFFWRDHSSYLLSVEFMQMLRAHLNPGGVYLYNTTESADAIATGLHVFPYALRILNSIVVSDSPIAVDKERWLEVLREYRIDGRLVFDPTNPATGRVLAAYMALADSANLPPRFLGMEYGDSMRARLGRRFIFTEDNMGWEWRSQDVEILWH